MNEGHDWQPGDDLAALYLHRCPRGRWSLEVLAAVTGIPVKSMRMRVSNYRALDTGHGLKHASGKSRRAFAIFKSVPCAELETELLAKFPGLRDADSFGAKDRR